MRKSFHQRDTKIVPNMDVVLREFKEKSAVIIPYIGWIGHDNVGDDIVFDIYCNLLADAISLKSKITPEVIFYKTSDTREMQSFFDWRIADSAVLGGGSTIDKFYFRKLVPAIEMGLPSYCFSSGYQKDTLPSDDDRQAVSLISGCHYGSLRGPQTIDAINQLIGGEGVALPPVIDAGLLASVYYMPQGVEDKLSLLKRQNKPLVAINSLDIPYEIGIGVEFIKRCAHLYDFIYIAMDHKTLKAGYKIKNETKDYAKIEIIDQFTNYGLILDTYRKSAFSLNMKLHASVLCASAQTPAISIGGGRKIDEFFSTIGALDLRGELTIDDILKKSRHAVDVQEEFCRRLEGLIKTSYSSHLACIDKFISNERISQKINFHNVKEAKIHAIQAKDYGVIALDVQM